MEQYAALAQARRLVAARKTEKLIAGIDRRDLLVYRNGGVLVLEFLEQRLENNMAGLADSRRFVRNGPCRFELCGREKSAVAA